MKQNPCRYCHLALDLKGKKQPAYRDECVMCTYRKEHTEYLVSQRKLVRGDVITSLEELLLQEYIFWGASEKPRHIETIKSLQLRIVLDELKDNWFYKAIRKESEDK